MMEASKDALELIKHFEGFKTRPYRCPVGLWTVGVGHVIGDGHSLPDVWNREFTVEEIDALLAQDVQRFARGIEHYVSVELTQGMFDALVCFAFNLGLGTFQRSSLLQKINRGDKAGAAESFLLYNKAGGKVLRGLDLRRKAEASLFLKEQQALP